MLIKLPGTWTALSSKSKMTDFQQTARSASLMNAFLLFPLFRIAFVTVTVGMHHDRSPRPQRGPPSHRRGYSTDFFIVNMHSGHFGPVRVEDTVLPVSSPETAAGSAARVS